MFRASRSSRRPVRARSAFSLIEVVAAVGIFAIGMVGVIGLFAPVARSVNSTADAEVAARVADALRLKLQRMSFAEVAALLKQSTASSHELTVNDQRADYDLSTDAKLLFANRDGTRIGVYADTSLWGAATAPRDPTRERFFEIALIRNETVSPKTSTSTASDGTVTTTEPDATAVTLAYTARLRWPAFIRDGNGTIVQYGANSGTVRFDHGKKQVLYFAGSITR